MSLKESTQLDRRLQSRRFRNVLQPSLAACFLICVAVSGCRQATTASGDAADDGESVAVAEIDEVTSQDHVRAIDVPASVESYEMAKLMSRLEGYVGTVKVDIGDELKKNAILAELDMPEIKHESRRMASMKIKWEKDVKVREEQEKQAREKKKQQEFMRDLRQKEFTRIEGLVRRGALTPEKRDEAKFALDSATAAVALADADIEAAMAMVAAAGADLDVAEAELAKARAMESYLQIIAPFPGAVTERNVDPGAFVKPGSNGGSHMFTVERVDKLRVVMFLPIEDAFYLGTNEYREADKDKDNIVLHNVFGQPYQKFSGKIARYSKSFNRNSRMMRAEMDWTNEKDKPYLKPGDYGTATIKLATYSGLATVKKSAIAEDENGFYVMVVDGVGGADGEGVCRYRPILVKAIDKGDDDEERYGIANAPSGTEFTDKHVISKNPSSFRDQDGKTIKFKQNEQHNAVKAGEATQEDEQSPTEEGEYNE